MKKGYVALAVMAILLISCFAYTAVAGEKQVPVKIYVGMEADDELIASSDNIIAEKLKANDKDKYTTLVTLNEYVSPKDLMVQNGQILEIFYWIPGETGRSISVVIGNDILGAIEKNIAELKASESDELMYLAEQYQQGNIGIFAYSISGTVEEISAATDNAHVKSVILHQDMEAESNAAKTGASVVYIDVPDKPDADNGVF